MHITPMKFSGLALSVAAMALLAAPLAQARTSEISGPKGGQVTHQVQRGGGDVSSSWTGANGKTAGRNVSRSRDETTANYYGPQGQTASRQVERSAEGASATVTGPQGRVKIGRAHV